MVFYDTLTLNIMLKAPSENKRVLFVYQNQCLLTVLPLLWCEVPRFLPVVGGALERHGFIADEAEHERVLKDFPQVVFLAVNLDGAVDHPDSVAVVRIEVSVADEKRLLRMSVRMMPSVYGHVAVKTGLIFESCGQDDVFLQSGDKLPEFETF